MTATVHETLCISPTDICAVEFLSKDGITGAAYYCGRCSLIAARGSDDLVYTDEGTCEMLEYYATAHDFTE